MVSRRVIDKQILIQHLKGGKKYISKLQMAYLFSQYGYNIEVPDEVAADLIIENNDTAAPIDEEEEVCP